MSRAFGWASFAAGLAILLSPTAAAPAETPTPSLSRVEAALGNVMSLNRPGQQGLATVFDGNKFVQCRRMSDQTMRCEAGGALLQPSLSHVLTPAKIDRLKELGWTLDPSFGSYVQIFPNGASANRIGEAIVQALAEGYDAEIPNLELRTDWIASQPCPPRNGWTQNLAGAISDPPALARGAIYACAYKAARDGAPHLATGSVAELIEVYGPRVTAEIQRLRVNLDRQVFVIFDAGIGYVQCASENEPPSIYCEAQSADSWPALAAVLTPDRIAKLHAAGFADPGRAPNYWKSYPLDGPDDATIAREMLTILHDVYGYTGAEALAIKTEKKAPL